jgi:hypothetical protein
VDLPVWPWALGTDLTVFYAIAIAYPLTFLVNGFNAQAGFAVVLVSTAMILLMMMSARRRIVRTIGAVLILAIVGQSIALAAVKLPELPPYWFRVSSTQASLLNRVLTETPENAEVIASWGVMGRFSDREVIFPLFQDETSFTVNRPTVAFVLAPLAGIEAMKVTEVMAAIRYIRHSLHARTLMTRDGIYAFLWKPPKDVSMVNLIALVQGNSGA